MTPSQYKQYINRLNAENKRRVDEYNRAVKKHNDNVNRNIDNYNRQVKKQVDEYNRDVRRYNAEQESRRQKINSAIRQFNNSGSVITSQTAYTVVLRQSTQVLNDRYYSLEKYNDANENNYNDRLLVDLPEKETSNSMALYNSLSGIDDGIYLPQENLQRTIVEDLLSRTELDLGKRWVGALYSLNPENPDATRHFCTSVREICTKLIDIKAPDEMVKIHIPDYEIHNGRPDRRSKIKYILSRKSISIDSYIDFVTADIDDIQNLFHVLNDGTHGSAGKLDVQQLLKLKKRVEDTIVFITNITS